MSLTVIRSVACMTGNHSLCNGIYPGTRKNFVCGCDCGCVTRAQHNRITIPAKREIPEVPLGKSKYRLNNRTG